MPMTAEQLSTRLKFDFKPADLGDSAGEFEGRLEIITTDALARPNTTDAQREAGARYLLLAAQLRNLTRQAQRLKSASGSEVERNLSAMIGEVRAQQAEQLTASGLAPSRAAARLGSVSIPIESSF